MQPEINVRSVALGVAFALAVTRVLPAWSAEEHSHPVPEKLGSVSFATSCAAVVAKPFERAVALLHSFAYTAAEQAFREVAMRDPSCAMAHWGIAMTYVHQLWGPPGPDDLRKGRAEMDQALSASARLPRERGFIAAAAAYYRDFEHVPQAVRAKAYEKAMGTVANDNPGDTEAQVFYALALLGTAPPEDRTHANQKRAAEILEPIYRAQADHPGAAHYLIHAYDSSELAPRGVAAARAYSKIAPSAPHALHMPSHIFTRLGLWDESIDSNLAARAAAHSAGDVGEELHAMDYLVYAYLQNGRDADAAQVVAALHSMDGLQASDFKIGYAATAMQVRMPMERHDWPAAALLQPLPESAPHVAALIFWARAVANARSGHPAAVPADIAQLEDCRQRLVTAGNAYWAKQVAVMLDEARGWQSAAAGNDAAAGDALLRAAVAEESLEKLPVTPGPIIPAREQLGDLLAALGRPKDALAAYQATLAEAPHRRGAVLGAAAAAAALGATRATTQDAPGFGRDARRSK